MLRIVILCLVPVAFPACASSNGTASSGDPRRTSSESGGGIWNQLDENRGRREQARAARELRERGASELPPGWRPRIEAWWATWCRQPTEVDESLDPRYGTPSPDRLNAARVTLRKDWVEARGEWVALGPKAVDILVDNLLAYYIRAFDAASGFDVQRTKEELGLFSEQAVPLIVEGLATASGDSVVRQRMAQLLSAFGDRAVAPVEEAWRRADEKGQLELVRALKLMRNEKAAPLLMRIAADRDLKFEIRIEAIDGLARLGAKGAAPTFRGCLEDRDPSVRKFAAMHFHAVSDGSRQDRNALVTAMERALDRGDLSVANACRNSLIVITGQRLPLDAAAWRRSMGS
jgi:hypothetical protein